MFKERQRERERRGVGGRKEKPVSLLVKWTTLGLRILEVKS